MTGALAVVSVVICRALGPHIHRYMYLCILDGCVVAGYVFVVRSCLPMSIPMSNVSNFTHSKTRNVPIGRVRCNVCPVVLSAGGKHRWVQCGAVFTHQVPPEYNNTSIEALRTVGHITYGVAGVQQFIVAPQRVQPVLLVLRRGWHFCSHRVVSQIST